MSGMQIVEYMRLILLIFMACSLLILVLIVTPKWKKYINGFTVILFGFVSIFVSGLLQIIMGIVVDEFNLGGFLYSLLYFIVIFVVCVFNFFYYFREQLQKVD